MKKKITVLTFSIVAIIAIGLFFYNQKITKEKEIEEKYQQAIENYESRNYERAYYLLSDIPNGYENRDELHQELDVYNKTYISAISLLEDRDYKGAVEKLKELPDGYMDKNLIIDNIDKIEKLVENTWCDELEDYDWYYETTFSLSAYSDNLTLYIFEDEYSGNTFMNTYTDHIDVSDLFDDGKADVKSNERDNFNIDINNVESGEYTMSTTYITSTYRIKDDSTSNYKVPNCIVDGCSYNAITSLLGISGEIEYYCREHYDQLSEMMTDVIGY